MNNGPGGASRAEHQRRAGVGVPLRRVLIQGTEETRAIGIVATEFSRFYPQGIHSFEPFRGWKLSNVAELRMPFAYAVR